MENSPIPRILPANPEEIPVVALFANYSANEIEDEEVLQKVITNEQFAQIRECGFNIVYFNLGLNPLMQSVINAQQNNLKVIYFQGNFNPSKSFLDNLNNLDNNEYLEYQNRYEKILNAALTAVSNANIAAPGTIVALSLDDQPSYAQLEANYNSSSSKSNDNFFCLRHRVELIRQTMLAIHKPDKPLNLPLWINLLPLHDDSTDNRLGPTVSDIADENEAAVYRYDRYLELFSTYCCHTWSYDMYPIKQCNCLLNPSGSCSIDNNGEVTVDHAEFYANLRIFGEKAFANGAEFWAFCESQSLLIGSSTFYPAALPGFLRFEAFSALAMGAKGIVYWTYSARRSSESGTCFQALTDKFGDKTAAWYFAKEVNDEIRKYSSVFRDSILLDYAHVGEIYPGCREMVVPVGFLDNVEVLSYGRNPQNRGLLVSYFKKGCGPDTEFYIVAVSHDPTAFQQVRFFFQRDALIEELTPVDSKRGIIKEPFLSTEEGVERIMIPGGWRIFKLHNSSI